VSLLNRAGTVDDQIAAEHDRWPMFIRRAQFDALTCVYVDCRRFSVSTLLEISTTPPAATAFTAVLNSRVCAGTFSTGASFRVERCSAIIFAAAHIIAETVMERSPAAVQFARWQMQSDRASDQSQFFQQAACEPSLTSRNDNLFNRHAVEGHARAVAVILRQIRVQDTAG